MTCIDIADDTHLVLSAFGAAIDDDVSHDDLIRRAIEDHDMLTYEVAEVV